MGVNLGTFALVSGVVGPNSLAFDKSGNLYASYAGSNKIHKFGPGGADLGTFADTGLNRPDGLVFDAMGNLYVANGGADYEPAPYMNTIHRFGPSGEDLGTFATLPAGANTQMLAFAPMAVPEPLAIALCAPMGALGLRVLRGREGSKR